MSTPSSNKKPEEKKGSGFQEKFSEKFQDLKKNENIEHMVNFAKTNTRDTIAYVALFVGVLMLFFNNFWGGVIVGVVGGIYFAEPIIQWLVGFKHYLETEGLIRVMILAALAVALLIQAPSIFLGVLGAVAVNYLFFKK